MIFLIKKVKIFNYKRRFHLSLVAKQTQQILLLFLVGLSSILLFLYLFLMNNLAMNGISLSHDLERSLELNRSIEQVEARLAVLQTNDFLVKTSVVSQLVPKRNSYFVTIPVGMYTAQK